MTMERRRKMMRANETKRKTWIEKIGRVKGNRWEKNQEKMVEVGRVVTHPIFSPTLFSTKTMG